MKAFIAIAISTLSKMNLRNLKHGITLAWTHDEEVGCLGAHALTHQLDEAGISLPSAMLIGEPTSLDICHHHGGHTTIEISITGKAAHSSKPHLGINANEWMYRCLAEIFTWNEWLKNQICPISQSPAILNIAQVKGGEAINITAGHASIRLGLRAMPSQDCNKLIEALKEQLCTIQQQIATIGGCIDIEVPQNAPPLLTKLPCTLEQALKKLLPEAKNIGVPFATDGGCFAQMGCQPIICGPGSIDIAHQPNEWVSIREIMYYEQMLGRLLQSWSE